MNAQNSSKSQSSNGPLLAEILFWPARVLLLAMVFASPWYYGSVTWGAQLYFVPITVIVFVLALTGAAIRRDSVANPLVWAISALLILAMLQTVSLPEWLWQSVSSSAAFERRTAEAFESFQTSSSTPAAREIAAGEIDVQPIPRTLSIHWVQSRASAVMFAVALACLISAGILFRTRNWELVVLCVLAVGGLGVAMIGLLQSVAWNKWTLLPMPTSSYFATFVSRNSAPQYLCIGLGAVFGLLAWWSSSKSDEADKKYYVRYPAVNAVARLRRRLEELLTDLDAVSLLCVFSATLMFVAILAASSRGGILSCFAASVVTLCVSLGTKQSYARTVGLVTLIACGATLLLTTLELDSAILNRMDSVNEEAYELDNGRFTVWRMILTAPWIWLPGCGLGNFHFAVLPTYAEPTAWFYHAENIYIELLAELGVTGFVIGIAGLSWLLWRIRWCVLRGRRAAPAFVATVLAGAGVGLQSLVDFSLILPAIFLSLSVLVGCFIARSECHDFGKKAKRNQHSRRKTRDSADPEEPIESQTSVRTPLIAVALTATIVLLPIWCGAKSLSGYVFAEQIERQLKDAVQSDSKNKEVAAETILRELDQAAIARFADHPEVNLAVGRVLQSFAADSLKQNLNWPSGITDLQKSSLSEPASIAAAFRVEEEDPRMQQLRDLALALPQQLEAIRRSAPRMAAAASVCAFDWRGEWGLVRSDLELLSNQSRARNYARLLQSTAHSSTIPARIGAAALMANERTVGIRFLHDFIARVPSQAIAISSIAVEHAPQNSSANEVAQEIETVLPRSSLLRTEVAEHFSRIPERASIANELASRIDLKELVREAKAPSETKSGSKGWLLVYWLASARSDTALQIEALENATTPTP